MLSENLIAVYFSLLPVFSHKGLRLWGILDVIGISQKIGTFCVYIKESEGYKKIGVDVRVGSIGPEDPSLVGRDPRPAQNCDVM